MPTVTHVRMERSSDGRHEHIGHVTTAGNKTYSRADVAAGLDRGETWVTRAASGNSAKIEKIHYCPAPACVVAPYIRTNRDRSADDNLDNLPRF